MSYHGRWLRFADLKHRNIVKHRATLYRWIAKHGFPEGVLVAPATRLWREDDVLDWLERGARNAAGDDPDRLAAQ